MSLLNFTGSSVLGDVLSALPQQQKTSVAGTLKNLGSTISNTVNSAAKNYINYANMGSAMANGVSAGAQSNQFLFNSAEAALQRDYNEQMWQRTADFNSAEAAANRDYQSAEAQANRDWQERMANTSYQRAVEDLKKAGLNPILAALNGGAGNGSGAMGSGSAASVSPTSGAAASGSNFTGQGYNMPAELAMIGMMGELIGQGMSAFGAYLNATDGINGKGHNTSNEKNLAYNMTSGLQEVANMFNNTMNTMTEQTHYHYVGHRK